MLKTLLGITIATAVGIVVVGVVGTVLGYAEAAGQETYQKHKTKKLSKVRQ